MLHQTVAPAYISKLYTSLHTQSKTDGGLNCLNVNTDQFLQIFQYCDNWLIGWFIPQLVLCWWTSSIHKNLQVIHGMQCHWHDHVDKSFIYKNIMTVYSGNDSIPTFTLVLISDGKLYHYHYTTNVSKKSLTDRTNPITYVLLQLENKCNILTFYFMWLRKHLLYYLHL